MSMDIDYDEPSKEMNRALLIPEILRLIIRHLHPMPEEGFENTYVALEKTPHIPLAKKTSQSLARAALVCTLFLEHALDYLWWFTNDLTPLFRLLPAFKPSSNTTKVSLIDGDIHPTDLQRFTSYACRVRGYHMEGKEHFHPSTIARVLRECDRTYLLPALQGLSVDKFPVALSSFIPPSLQYLSANSDSNRANQDVEIYPTISSLPRITPDLRHLSSNSNLSNNALAAITRLSRLDSLFLDYRPVLGSTHFNINISLILQLASANTLRDLRIAHFFRFNSFPTSWNAPQITSFSALENLDITIGGPTISTFNILLRSIVLPRLESLTIYIPVMQHHPDQTDRKHWLDFFRILPEITSNKLHTLSAFAAEGLHEHDSWSSLGLSIKDIPDLSHLNLKSFNIHFPLFSSISTSCLEHIASHWPTLTTLNLGDDQKPVLGLHALSFLAQSLPYLEDLAMCLPSEANIAAGDFPVLNHALRTLRLYELNAPSPREVGRALDRLFPKMEDYTLHALSEDAQDQWDEVLELLGYLRSSRDDQMERQMMSDEVIE